MDVVVDPTHSESTNEWGTRDDGTHQKIRARI
jgi:hypothetical protein